ncbi:hypothetical protein [Polyangium aurulentum]|uniref:hypothetical protein n=1 Tax=Polyangium aurulentum TaxID=2567896 RepID=UPI0010AE8943|nr:hypothetical protein [Polyangium aurulentum]UQA58403.1 hypothetical protein E8A73_045360 [Polyangium aurulentum]
MASAWLFAGIAAVELGSGHPEAFHDTWIVPAYAAVRNAPTPLPEGDADGDGLLDTREAELARQYAPIVILDARDSARPASVPWVMARTNFVVSTSPRGPRTRTRAFDKVTRRGSDRPADWVTYTYVYPRVDGGINIQYWFYYPYNDGPLFFDHESDWEHLTMRLDAKGAPLGAYLARHEDNNPGPYFAWSRLRREGNHPVVLSAKGSHATYADRGDLAWYESSGWCDNLKSCVNPVWRTWEGGGLEPFEEFTPASPAMAQAFQFPGRWGSVGFWPGTSAPKGPMHQAGYCVAGFPNCRQPTRGQASASASLPATVTTPRAQPTGG